MYFNIFYSYFKHWITVHLQYTCAFILENHKINIKEDRKQMSSLYGEVSLLTFYN
jgi:hypothetical protein